MKTVTIEKNDAGQRLDRFLKKYLKNASLSFIYKAIRKDVKINGKRKKEDYLLCEEDEINLYIADDQLEKLVGREKDFSDQLRKNRLKIVYEDENILIINKPAGILIHGDSREKKKTLANEVCGYLQMKGEFDPSQEKTFVPSPANRLDRNTSGLVIFGKNAESLRYVNALLREKSSIRKFYRTIVAGELKEPVTFRDRLARVDSKNRSMILEGRLQEGETKFSCHEKGKEQSCERVEANTKEIITKAVPLKSKKGYTLLEIELITGRTHQIRAHLAEKGLPIVGDSKYGNKKVNAGFRNRFGLSSQLLHAVRLEFGTVGEVLADLRGKKISSNEPKIFRKIEEDIFGR